VAAGFLRRLLAPPPLRPPGARPEAELDALCIRCGRCVAACPYRALRPGGLRDGAGVPLVVARQAPCLLCMLCPPACPTGALDAGLTDPRRVRMGQARVDEGACYAFLGVLCRTCVDECPLEGEAIRQDDRLRPVVTERCVGCGVCEARCPAADPAIRVVPAALRQAQGERRSLP
jgi:MauM/NapG family ferredoxin protein